MKRAPSQRLAAAAFLCGILGLTAQSAFAAEAEDLAGTSRSASGAAPVAAAAPVAPAAPIWKALVVRPEAKDRIPGLTLQSNEAVVAAVTNGESVQQVVTLTGKFEKSGLPLLFGKKGKVTIGKGGNFELKLVLTGQLTEGKFTTILPTGVVQMETVKVVFKDWLATQVETRSPHVFSPSLGYSLLSYSETGLNPALSESALTVKLAYGYRFPKTAWDVSASAYLTTLVLKTNDPATQARFFGANIRMGYAFPLPWERWTLSIMPGFYLINMVGSTASGAEPLGFTGLMGPQIFPVLRYAFTGGQVVLGYFKYSPLFSPGLLAGAGNAETAFGATFSLPLGNGSAIPISVDVSNVKLTVDNGEGFLPSAVKLSTFSFSVGYVL